VGNQLEHAASELISLVGGRQTRHVPLEIEVSPSHMSLVDDTIQRLNGLELDGTSKEHIKIYFIWTDFIDNLILPPKENDSISRSKGDLQKAHDDLY